MTLFTPIFQENPPYRVLSCDGGGIYGLFTAIMLRRLCECNPGFLSGNQVTLFAGTSAGALISLLLAKYEQPREALLSGEAESIFWNEYTYSNKLDPVQRVSSLFGLTAWSGKADFDRMLTESFGDLKMGDLQHRVLITAFRYTGNAATQQVPHWHPRLFCNFPNNEPDRDLPVKFVAYAAASPVGLRPVVDGYADGGIFADDPALSAIAKLMEKSHEQQQGEVNLRQVLSALDTITSKLRALLEALLDEAGSRSLSRARDELLATIVEQTETLRALFDADRQGMDELARVERQYIDRLAEYAEALPKPHHVNRSKLMDIVFAMMRWELELVVHLHEVLSIAAPQHIEDKKQKFSDHFGHVEYLQQHLTELDGHKKGTAIALGLLEPFYAYRKELMADIIPHRLSGLDDLRLLSLGVGTNTPSYFTPNINLGVLPFNMLPTNIETRNFFPALSRLLLEPSAEGTDFQAKQLLTAENYHRLDPPVLGFPVPPVLWACYLARIDFWRVFMASEIERMCDSETAQNALDETLQWIEQSRWTEASGAD